MINRNGFSDQILIMVILAFVLGIIMAAFFAYSIIEPKITDQITDLGNAIQNDPNVASNGNLSNAVSVSKNVVINSLPILNWLGYALFIVAMLSFLYACYIVKVHPALLWIWIALMAILIVAAIFLDGAYSSMTDTSLEGNFVMDNMSTILIGFGVIGGIILFALRGNSQEAQYYGWGYGV